MSLEEEVPMEIDDDGECEVNEMGSTSTQHLDDTTSASTNSEKTADQEINVNSNDEAQNSSNGPENVEAEDDVEAEEETQVIEVQSSANLFDDENGDEQEQDFETPTSEGHENSRDNMVDDPLVAGRGTKRKHEDDNEGCDDADDAVVNVIESTEHNFEEQELSMDKPDDGERSDNERKGVESSNNHVSENENSSGVPEREPEAAVNGENDKDKGQKDKDSEVDVPDAEESVPLLSLDEEETENQAKENGPERAEIGSDDESVGMIKIKMDGIFETHEDQEADEEGDEDRTMDPVDIENMLQMSFNEDQDGSQDSQKEKPQDEDESKTEKPEEETPTRRPRRAAAAAAAEKINEISSEEKNVDETRCYGRRHSRKDDDKPFKGRLGDSMHDGSGKHGESSKEGLHKCHICKKVAECSIKVQQFGTDIHLCSNACFNEMRYPNSKGKRRLQCAHCGINNMVESQGEIYYWETMNFCSDLCVGNYQIEVGGKCAWCTKKVPWLSLGKYCVRFGSDVRQFCTASCLENYKKNARVCFHCQLDIKRLANVIMANIPSKNSPKVKEFCSQDCVEMYVEQNLPQSVKPKSGQTCIVCSEHRNVFRELVLPSANALRVCSMVCWNSLIKSKNLSKTPSKCETCPKYTHIDYDVEPPAHYIATEDKLYGFCSPTCKNVFVLKHRQILSCTTCKVKKYNYDLVQFFKDKVFRYAVCSLNCLPTSAEYVNKLKETLTPAPTASELYSRQNALTVSNTDTDSSSFPVINSVTSLPPEVISGTSFSDEGPVGGINGVIQNQLQSFANQNTGSNDQQGYVVSTGTENTYNIDGKEYIVVETDEPDEWDGTLMPSHIDEVLRMVPAEVETVSKYTMAKPKQTTVETQTDTSALEEMERVPLKTVEKIRYVPMPIPYPVYIPTPTFLWEKPVPCPMAVPIPVPIPIPIIFNGDSGSLLTDGISSALSKTVAPDSGSDNDARTPCENGVTSEVDRNNSINQIGLVNGFRDTNVEMLDCTTPVVLSSNSIDLPTAVAATNVSTIMVATEVGSVATSPCIVNSAVPIAIISSSNTNEVASSPGGGKRKLSKSEFGIKAWKMSFGVNDDPLNYDSAGLAIKLAEWVKKGSKPNGERYRADIMIYLSLGIQQYLMENNRTDSIFYETVYQPFVKEITDYSESDCAQGINTRIEEYHFWEAKQLGSSSPGVLLFTLMFIIYKNFNLKTWQKHSDLHFGNIRIDKKLDNDGNEYKVMSIKDDANADDESNNLEVRAEMTDKCPVRLLEFYISKCERPDGPFYKSIKEDYSTLSPWYSTEPLDTIQIYQMLVRAQAINETPTNDKSVT